MSKQKDLYKILGVNKSAEQAEIKAAYKKLVRRYHPDLNPNDPKAEEKFKEVAVAFEVLGDLEKRKRYDEFGVAGLREGFDPNQAHNFHWGGSGFDGGIGGIDFDIGSLFEQFFGGQSSAWPNAGGQSSWSRAPKPTRGADLEYPIELDFLKAVQGGKQDITINKPISTVHGTKQKRVELVVSIPSGIADGGRIRLSGQGASGKHQGPHGDLFLIVKVRPHALYQRDGQDLLMELPLRAYEAYHGTQLQVPTPTGSVKLRVPPRSQSGQKLRLRGKGVQGRRGKSNGNLLVKLKVLLPDQANPKVLELLEELEAHYDTDIREDFAAHIHP